MKAKSYLALITCLTFIQFGLTAQVKPLPLFDLEPFKPMYIHFNALVEPAKPQIVNNKLIWVEESKESYNKRNAEYQKVQYAEYINSTEYKKWLKEHEAWRSRNPNWKELTRYTELLSSAEILERRKPEPLIGEMYNISSTSLNLRAQPDKSSAILKVLNPKSSLKLIDADNSDWWLVEVEGVQGYASSVYLKIDPMSGWDKLQYVSGAQPECININPKYDYTLDNFLNIKVGSGTDAVVKLMRSGSVTEECIRIVYVRSNDSFRIENIPEGHYYLKIAYGRDFRKKVINNQCRVKFMISASYNKGSQMLDFYKIKRPDQIVGNQIYERYSLPSYQLFLDVVHSERQSDVFKSDKISEFEFNN